MQPASQALKVLVSHTSLCLLRCPGSSLVSSSDILSTLEMTPMFPLLYYTKQFLLFLLSLSNSFCFESYLLDLTFYKGKA